MRFSFLLSAFPFILFSLPAYSAGSEASFENNILSLPVVTVGAEAYNLELLLTQDGANIDFSIVGAEKIQVVDTIGASVFNGTALLVPKVVIGGASYTLTLSVVTVDPPKFRLTDYAELKSVAEVPQPEPDPPKAPEISLAEKISTLYAETISSQIVMRRCVACHVQGGISQMSRLVFSRGTGNNVQSDNLAQFTDFVSTNSAGDQLILARVSGIGHGGGTVLPKGSADYNALSEFLALVKSNQN
ncbi:hypothetical protein N9X66_06230 [Gammaproteobacteria bacterium]|nr:hypothetical protein [Gammaproteobacteria bacterium]